MVYDPFMSEVVPFSDEVAMATEGIPIPELLSVTVPDILICEKLMLVANSKIHIKMCFIT